MVFKKGYKQTEETKRKLSLYIQEKASFWKGDKVGYPGIHYWIRTYGKKDKCEFCGSNKNFDWANKSGKYKRDLKDWIRLCRKCHFKYDKKLEKIRKFLPGHIPWNKGKTKKDFPQMANSGRKYKI